MWYRSHAAHLGGIDDPRPASRPPQAQFVMGPVEQHLDAIIAAVVVGLGSVLVHVMTVGRMQANIAEMAGDIREMKTGLRRANKRFHWLNNFSMGMFASIRRLCDHNGIEMSHLEGYDFENENGAEAEEP